MIPAALLCTIWSAVAPIANTSPADRLLAALSTFDACEATSCLEIARVEGQETAKRNVWGAAGKRMLSPVWYPYWAGVGYDLYTTNSTLTTCATPEARAAGWSCHEGNPLAGGSTNAGRIAVSAGVSYGAALLLTWVENFESEKAGEPVRLKWWQELIFTSAVGTARGLVGYLNSNAEARILDDIR